MARALRIAWEGAWYHIIHRGGRGHERGVIFLDDEDRRHLLGMLARMSERYRILLHVYSSNEDVPSPKWMFPHGERAVSAWTLQSAMSFIQPRQQGV